MLCLGQGPAAAVWSLSVWDVSAAGHAAVLELGFSVLEAAGFRLHQHGYGWWTDSDAECWSVGGSGYEWHRHVQVGAVKLWGYKTSSYKERKVFIPLEHRSYYLLLLKNEQTSWEL